MLVDDVTIRALAGRGGKGAVAFQKNMMSLGPTGGSGGHGGGVFFEGVADIGALRNFRYKKEFAAADGREGRSQFRDGHDGADLVLKVPVGTVIHNLTKQKSQEIPPASGLPAMPIGRQWQAGGTPYSSFLKGDAPEGRRILEKGKYVDITKIGERVLAAAGGRGGKGNFHFRGPRNTSPKQFQPGLPGEKFTFRLELKLIADVGLIGLPNAGKSSLLNALTKAQSKIANYAFTTLEPHLGAYYGLILADIPGLIEDSSLGKGLGAKFLRHVERTNALFHLVSVENNDLLKAYRTVRKELETYSSKLAEKEECVFLSKSDLASDGILRAHIEAFAKHRVKAMPLSVQDPAALESVKKILAKIIEGKTLSNREYTN